MPAGAASGSLYLVDAHSLIFQVFHAIPEMSSPAGLPTNALFGFTRDMLFLREEKKPDYLVCVFDMPGKTFRDEIFPEYKAHRTPTPNDLQLQIPLIYQLLEAMNIPVLGKERFEADDLIATAARKAAERGLDVFVCTTDKDCRQLIDDRIKLYNLRKHAIFDRATLLEDWGITPEQVVDLQALVGDSVDNVPGVQGIGLKTAARLLQEFASLDNLLKCIDQVGECKGLRGAKSIAEKLRAAADTIELSRRLVRLDTNVPVEMNWDAWRLHDWNAPRLLSLFKEWGFHRFADMVRKQAAEVVDQGAAVKDQESEIESQDSGAVDADAGMQGELFPFGENVSGNGEAKSTLRDAAYHLVDTPEKFKDFYKELRKQKRFAMDLETTHVNPIQSKIVGIAFSWQPGEAWYLALRAPESEPTLDSDETLTELAKLFENPKIAKVNQNIKYDVIALRSSGITLAGVSGDPMVADYLLHAGERSHSLEDLSLRYLNHRVIPIADLIGKGKSQLSMDQVSAGRVAEYSGEDADMAWQLCNLLEPKLASEKLEPLYHELEVPLIAVLAELEYNGIRLDVPRLRQMSKEMAAQLAAVEQDIYDLAGHSFNIASPRQLRQVLFDELKLPAQRRTGISGEASTDQETLERLAILGHPLPKKIVEHRQISKLKGTYVDALPDLINPATGRVHASFNQTVAATGRLSSSDPNLQNIPVRSEQGRQIRQAFLPAEGWLLLTADYSQIELRLLAHFCGDAALRRVFAEDADVHALVAAQIFGVSEQEVTSEMRRAAKTVNFGVIYGISPFGLATRLGMPKEDAARFIEAYFTRYPKVLEYQARLLEGCRKNRCVSTILGRRREITGIRPDSTYQQRNQPEREAINMELQGSAADLIKMAMLNIHRRLQKEKRQSRMLLQIHDELVFETPPEEADEVAALVAEEMTTPLEKAWKLEVPLKVDLAVGQNWLDVDELQIADCRLQIASGK